MTTLRSESGRPLVYLHIGAMKTGTTYLQQLMYANRDRLAEGGLVLPGRHWSRQVHGVQDILELDRGDAHIVEQSEGAWQELLDEALAEPGRVSVISMEFLSFAGPQRVRRVVESLAGAEVRVVLTVRDMTAALPSHWQTVVHNGATFSWADYLRALPSPRVPPHWGIRLHRGPTRNFHRGQNIARILDAWRPVVPAGCLHVVTVPAPGAPADELWRRFASVVGVDPALATEPPRRRNESLGYPSTELVRRVNNHIGPLPSSEYNPTIKDVMALDWLARRARLEERARLSRPAYDLALSWNAFIRDAVAASGAIVTGDLERDLPVDPDPALRGSLPQSPPDPAGEDMLDAAQDAWRGVRKLLKRRNRRLVELGVEVAGSPLPGRRAARRTWEAADDPVDAAATDLAGAARQAALALRAIRTARERQR